jgi:hypothetical protein
VANAYPKGEHTPGTHLGQERLGGPSADMGRMSPLR